MRRQVRELIIGGALALTLASCTKDKAPEVAAPAPEQPKAAEAQHYDVSLQAQGDYVVGQAIAVASVSAREGFHVNPDYPVSFKPAADSTVKFGGERVPLSDGKSTPCAAKAEDACRIDFDLPFTVEQAGPQQVKGTLAFSVCSADKCLIEKVPLTLALSAK